MTKPLIAIVLLVVGIALYGRWRLYAARLNVSSWYRTPWRNYEVGGKNNSQHMIGWAFDVTPSNPGVQAKLESMNFGTVINEGDHIHVSIL